MVLWYINKWGPSGQSYGTTALTIVTNNFIMHKTSVDVYVCAEYSMLYVSGLQGDIEPWLAF